MRSCRKILSLCGMLSVILVSPKILNAFEIQGVGINTTVSKAIDVLTPLCNKIENRKNQTYKMSDCKIGRHDNVVIILSYDGFVFKKIDGFQLLTTEFQGRRPDAWLDYFRGNTRTYVQRKEWSCSKPTLSNNETCEAQFTQDGGKAGGYKTYYYTVGVLRSNQGNVFYIEASS